MFIFAQLSFAETQSSPDGRWGVTEVGDPSKAAFRIDSPKGSTNHARWRQYYDFAKAFTALDESPVGDLQNVLCSGQRNLSSLVVGQSREYFRHTIARFAYLADESNKDKACSRHIDFEINLPALSAGHSHVGELEEFWNDNIVKPGANAPMVYIISDLSAFMGIGTHDGTDVGLETNLVDAIQSGELIVIAYLDEYDYQRLQNSRYRYVLNAFAQKLEIGAPDATTVGGFLSRAQEVSGGRKESLSNDDQAYLMQQVAKYLPNQPEPDRSLSVLRDVFEQFKSKKLAPTTKIDRETIRTSIGQVAHVPDWLIQRKWDVIRGLQAQLDQKVIGQATVKEQMMRLVKIGYSVGHVEARPIATTLFAGPTGTGKSFIADRTARYLGLPLVTIDMTQYTNPDAESRFVDTVASALMSQPYAIYLFEEIDKADARILDKLFFMLDEGKFYDRNQRPLFAGGAFVILTTNAGEKTIIENAQNPDLEKIVMTDLRRQFRDSFLNRFDAISIFKPFTAQEFQSLAKVMADERVGLIAQQNEWKVSLDKAAVEYVGVHGQSKLYGARPMKRLLQSVIEFGISEWQFANRPLPLGPESIQIRLVDANARRFAIEIQKKKVEYTVIPDSDTSN